MPSESGVTTGPDPSSMRLVDYAVAALSCEVTPHRPKQNGTKMPQAEPVIDRDGNPVLKPNTDEQAWGWIHRQTIRPAESEVRRQFGKPGVTGFGIITGVV